MLYRQRLNHSVLIRLLLFLPLGDRLIALRLNHWDMMSLKPIAILSWDYVRFYQMENSMLRQWPASSLSTGEMKAVATVCETAIALYSHWQFAPKWLSPLIVTNLVVSALKLGDSPKIKFTFDISRSSMYVCHFTLLCSLHLLVQS